jgi:hypothetical protein
MGVFRSDEALLKSAEAKPPRSVHRLDKPTGLSLSMAASPQCRFRFARQNHCSPGCGLNFRMRRQPPTIVTWAELRFYDLPLIRQVVS